MLKKVIIETSRMKAFMENAFVVTDMEKGQPGFMLAWGVSGRGKSECAEQFCMKTGALYMRFQEDWTPLEMLKWLCRELNGMEPRSIARAKYIIQEELDSKGLSIVIDEADRLSIKHFEHCRDIFDNIGTSFIFVGETALYAKLATHERFIKRITRSIEIGPVKPEDVIRLGMQQCDLKIEAHAAVLMAKMSKGSISEINRALYELEKTANKNKDNCVTVEMVNAIPDRIKRPKKEKLR